MWRARLPKRIASDHYLKLHYAIHPPRCRAALLRGVQSTGIRIKRRASKRNRPNEREKKIEARARALAS